MNSLSSYMTSWHLARRKIKQLFGQTALVYMKQCCLFKNDGRDKSCGVSCGWCEMAVKVLASPRWPGPTSSTQTCMCVQVSSGFLLLSAEWSIVIGLSVSGLRRSFVPRAFCRWVTRGQRRKAWTEEGRWADSKWRMFASRRAWLIPSTKSPDI